MPMPGIAGAISAASLAADFATQEDDEQGKLAGDKAGGRSFSLSSSANDGGADELVKTMQKISTGLPTIPAMPTSGVGSKV